MTDTATGPRPSPGKEYALVPHPDFPSRAITSITVSVERPDAAALTLRYCATGLLANVLVPDEVAPGFQDGLWRHSCFEAFAGIEGAQSYTEFNFSPSGRYAAYDFDDYRDGMRAADAPTVSHISMMRWQKTLELTWLVQWDAFEQSDHWQLALSAVIEETNGTKSFWALAHAPGPPDFHNRDCFIATLPAPEQP